MSSPTSANNRESNARRKERAAERSLRRMRLSMVVPDVAIQLAVSLGAPRSVVIDCETTGLDPEYDEILQVAVIDADDGRPLVDTLVRPLTRSRWRRSEAVHGITPEMVDCAPEASEVAVAVGACIMTADEVIGYNVDFDLAFLAAIGVTPDEDARVVDVMAEFARVYGQPDGRGGYRWQKLRTAARYYGIDWDTGEEHSALGDCLVARDVYWFIRDGAPPGDPYLV